MPLDVSQQKGIDPHIYQCAHSIYGMAIVAEPDDGLGLVDWPSLFIEEFDSDDDVGCHHYSKGYTT